jgi:deoxyribodipyrimidine photolyase-related protein
LSKDEAKTRYVNSKKHMARFYKSLRQDKKILVTGKGEPVGGQWSFDAENRQSLKKGVLIPNDPTWIDTQAVRDAKEWLTQQTVERYGAENVWIPYTHRDAEIWLQDFLTHRFVSFGAYEDALSETHVRLFHAAVSPLLNIGLLTPTQVLDSAMLYAKEHTVPLNSLEGFVRQILGWREFVRAAYECDGVTMRTKNFWNHTRKLSPGFWNGTTGLLPVDTAIKSALQFGYNHHIERLMVLGNSMVLLQTDPDEVYRWFMAMYVDAYDWVMVPNVYGMSQFADGGIFATKPYISGSNYIKKMSSYKKGVWEDIWTSLYWNFIATHETFFLNNHRLSMMPRLLTNMDPDKKAQHLKTATKYLSK